VEYVKQNNDKKSNRLTIGEKDLRGHLEEEKDKKEDDKKPGEVSIIKDDNQIQRAVDLLKSWEVFKNMNNG